MSWWQQNSCICKCNSKTQPGSPQTSHENAHTRWLTNLSWSALRKRGRIMWRKLLVRSSLGWLLALLIEPFNLLLRKLWSVAEEESDDEGRQMEWEREEEVCGAKLQRQRSGESEKMRDWAVKRGRCGWIGQESMVWMRMISVASAWFMTDVFVFDGKIKSRDKHKWKTRCMMGRAQGTFIINEESTCYGKLQCCNNPVVGSGEPFSPEEQQSLTVCPKWASWHDTIKYQRTGTRNCSLISVRCIFYISFTIIFCLSGWKWFQFLYISITLKNHHPPDFVSTNCILNPGSASRLQGVWVCSFLSMWWS